MMGMKILFWEMRNNLGVSGERGKVIMGKSE